MKRLFLIVHLFLVLVLALGCAENKQTQASEQNLYSTNPDFTTQDHHDDFFFRNGDSGVIVESDLINNNNQFIDNYSYITSSTIKWPTNVIKWWYNPAGQPSNFSTDAIIAGMQASAKRWSDVCGVSFEYQGLTTNTVNLTNCDGKTVVGWSALSGSVIGRTQVCFRGSSFNEFDLALDNEQPLQISNADMMTKTAVHELGHAFGLGHTNISPAVMTSFLTTGFPVNDDVQGCQSLYGAANITPAPAVEQPSEPKICSANKKKSCSVPNGRGNQICIADGNSWSSCQVTNCNRGYVLTSGVCVRK